MGDHVLIEPTPVGKPDDRIRALVKKGEDVTSDDSIPIKRYWASGRQLLRMANVYLDEKDFEKSFILYMKYIILYFDKLPKHVEYRNADVTEKTYVRSNCTKIIQIAEEVKSKILARYQREYDDYLEKKSAYDQQVKESQLRKQRQLEEQVAKQQKQQKDQFLTNFQHELDKKKRELAGAAVASLRSQQLPGESNGYQSETDSLISEDYDSDSPPSPPTGLLNSLNFGESSQKPTIDRSTKPAVFEEPTIDGFLSQMIVPFRSIKEKFSILSRSNTDRNVETCAILAGELRQNCFTITHLLVPKQSGTSDTCAASNEEELIIEQERLQLITLGWIHTHPSQRAFLSSVDLHTHAPYQKMLPEAIAIVVAPRANEIGTYSLTEFGLETILRCRQSGFHPHPNESRIYGDASHVRIDDTLTVEVVDFR